MSIPTFQAPSKKNSNGTPFWKVSPASGSSYINSVAVSADGDNVVGGTFFHSYSAGELRRGPVRKESKVSQSDDGTFGTYCCDRDGALLWKNEFWGWQGVYWVAISADGSKAAPGGFMAQSPQAGFARAFDATGGQPLLNHPTTDRVNHVALSADGAWLVSAAETHVIFCFDSTTLTYTKTDEYTPLSTVAQGGLPNGITSIGISNDGRSIVFADYAGHVGVMSNTAGKLAIRRQWKMAESFCHMVAFTSDGTSFAAGGAAGVFYLCVTEKFVATGVPTYAYDTGVKEPVYGVAISEDGSVFTGVVNSGSAGNLYVDGTIDHARQLIYKYSTDRNPNSVSINLARGLVAVADGHPDGTPGHFYLVDAIEPCSKLPIVTPSLAWEYQTGNMSWPIAISATGSAIVGGSDDSYIYNFAP